MIRQTNRAFVLSCAALIFGLYTEISQAGIFTPPGTRLAYRAARINTRLGMYQQPGFAAYGPSPYVAGYGPFGGWGSYSVGYSPMPVTVGYAPYGMDVAYGYDNACCQPCNSCCNSCSGGGCSGGSCPGGNCGSAQTYKAEYPERAIPDENASGSNSGTPANPNNNYNNSTGPAADDGFVPPKHNSGVNNSGGDAPDFKEPTSGPAPFDFIEPSAGSNLQLPKLQPIGPVAKMSWDAKIVPARLTREARFSLPVVARHVEQPRILVPAPSPIQIAGK